MKLTLKQLKKLINETVQKTLFETVENKGLCPRCYRTVSITKKTNTGLCVGSCFHSFSQQEWNQINKTSRKASKNDDQLKNEISTIITMLCDIDGYDVNDITVQHIIDNLADGYGGEYNDSKAKKLATELLKQAKLPRRY